MDQLGSYRLRKRLAVGGMGEVYLGEKIGPEGFVKPVVLKCVLPQLAKDRAFVQLFLDEARLAALLNHPNIAQVYDFGLVDDIYYIAMEYVPGYTVDDIRRKLKSIGQHMPLQHIANIASQVCQGLHYAHTLTDANGVSLGLVHRDVSPHNLIVSIDGSVKIVDFGIAKARAGLTRVQAKGAVGKFGYMSPEQARGEQVDARSDSFSLGICLWELCTNERLHDPNLDRSPEYSPARPIPPVDQFRPEVPRQFQQILDIALAIDVQDRYRTGQDMHLALERFQAAMTHYAGQAALAAYIKDLVEGRVENPETAATGSTVEPAGGGSGPAGTRPGGENMDAAQKYEEVFGVTMASKRPRPKMRAVPKSWETKEPAPAPAPTRAPPENRTRSGPRMVDLSGGRGPGASSEPEPELELASHEPRMGGPPAQTQAAPRPRAAELPTPKAAAPARSVPWGPIVLVLLVAGLGAAGFLFKDRMGELLALVQPKDEPAADLTSRVKVVSEPTGADVFLDGTAQGKTPAEFELIPGIEHRITVRKKGLATFQKTLEGKAMAEVPVVKATLPPAGRLRVTTVPPGASVRVNDRVIDDATPVTLDDVPAGVPLKVHVEIEGMPPQVRSVTVKKGRTQRVRVDLVKG